MSAVSIPEGVTLNITMLRACLCIFSLSLVQTFKTVMDSHVEPILYLPLKT